VWGRKRQRAGEGGGVRLSEAEGGRKRQRVGKGGGVRQSAAKCGRVRQRADERCHRGLSAAEWLQSADV
jgi:hypothetical protein